MKDYGKLVEEGIEYIFKNYGEYFDDRSYLSISKKYKKLIEFSFPGIGSTNLSEGDFLNLIEELKDFKGPFNNSYSTKSKRFFQVEFLYSSGFVTSRFDDLFDEKDIHQIVLKDNLSKYWNDYKVSIEFDSIYTKFIKISQGEYDSKHHVIFDFESYVVVECDSSKGRDFKKEEELFYVYLYEVLEETGLEIIPWSNSEIKNEFNFNRFKPEISAKYDRVIGLFISALKLKGNSIQFLEFYKVIENIGVYLLKRNEANELVSILSDRKIDDNLDDLVRKVVDVFYSNKKRKNYDRELPKIVIAELDFKSLIDILPIKTRKKILHNENCHSFERIGSSKEGDIIKKLADSISTIRNEIAHAKSNYREPSSYKLFDVNDIVEINIFMKKVCLKIIRSYLSDK
ncbi:MAG: hypothetical protein NXI21_19435 [Alphaproteobacteria bacterium]|nr:hypothetical protein [Alphaproteobacteria bacterium]